MRNVELICIVCPSGCRLLAEQTPEGVMITGHKCPRGDAYGRDEIIDPRRIVTAVVRTTDPRYPCVPVKSDRPVSRKYIGDILRQLYGLRVAPPVGRGEVCLPDCCGSGASIVFTRTVPPRSSGGDA